MIIGRDYYNQQVALMGDGDWVEFEKRVNKAIVNRMDSHDPTLPITVAIGSFSARSVERAIKELTASGWFAIRVSDGRDGDYLEIR